MLFWLIARVLPAPLIAPLKVTVFPLLPKMRSCVPAPIAIGVVALKSRSPFTGLISAKVVTALLRVSVPLKLKVWSEVESFSMRGARVVTLKKSKSVKPLPVMVKAVSFAAEPSVPVPMTLLS